MAKVPREPEEPCVRTDRVEVGVPGALVTERRTYPSGMSFSETFTSDSRPVHERTDCDNCRTSFLRCGIVEECCRTCKDLAGATHRWVRVEPRVRDYTSWPPASDQVASRA